MLFNLKFKLNNVTTPDIGGGYKSGDREGDKMSTEEIGNLIQRSVQDNFHSIGEYPTVVAEPGA